MNRLFSLTALSLAPLAIACGSDTRDPQPTSAPTTAAHNPVDGAIADAETGRDLPAVRSRLEAMLVDPSVSKSDHAKVALALSRLVESTDHERAIVLAEDAVASGSDDAQGKLFTLLTGKAPPSPWSHRGPRPQVPASAKALAKYFPATTPNRTLEVRIHQFGGTVGAGVSPPGTFEIGDALREAAAESCGYCEESNAKVHTMTSREPSWVMIPRVQNEFGQALVVTYVDAETLPPARYEKWFAASIAEMKSALEAGKGLVAVKERPGVPPLVTIAAPRMAQLPLVEAKFAEMTKLPLEPQRVDVQEQLSKDEIQGIIRARFAAIRKCYDELSTRRPMAAGRIDLAFTIKADGTTKDVSSTVDGTLEDATFQACAADVVRTTQFPAWSHDESKTTTVRYPISFAR